MIALRPIAALLLFACTGAAAQDHAIAVKPAVPDVRAEAVERGHLFTTHACSSCHATGPTGESPMPEAAPFRVIVHRYPLDQLEEGFAEGLVTSHPAMPEFIFRASEIDDLVAYLETLRDEP